MPFVKPLPPISAELQALMDEAHKALEGAEVGKPAPFPHGLMDRIDAQMQKEFRDEYIARRRLEWLHSSESGNVDGWEWGIYRVRYDAHGQPVEMLQTFSDFSDLDAAIEKSSAPRHLRPDWIAAEDAAGGVLAVGAVADTVAAKWEQHSTDGVSASHGETFPPAAAGKGAP
jgi:hypothetical protein